MRHLSYYEERCSFNEKFTLLNEWIIGYLESPVRKNEIP